MLLCVRKCTVARLQSESSTRHLLCVALFSIQGSNSMMFILCYTKVCYRQPPVDGDMDVWILWAKYWHFVTLYMQNLMSFRLHLTEKFLSFHD
jgi:hypothetical protein